MKYKNYYNFELGNRDIYSRNDILGMTVQDLFDNELPLSYQYNTIGIPKDDELINSPNTHQYTNANGKLRWRSSSKTTEDLLEEERQRRAALEAQNQAAQSQLTSIPTQSAPLANTVTEDLAPSPITNTQPLLNDNTISAIGNFAGKMINKIKNRKQTTPADGTETSIGTLPTPQQEVEQPVEPQTPTEPEDTQNIFQRLGGKIKDVIGSLNDPKELREYKQMSRDIDRANKERQAWAQAHPEEAYGDLESLSTTANPNPWDTGYGKVVLGGPDYSMINTGGIVPQNKKPLESFAPISEHIELGYPKSINMPGINPNESILKKNPYYPFEVDDRGMIVLKGGTTKDVNKESLMQQLKRKVKDFQETGFNKEDDRTLKEEVQGYLHDKSKLYRNYEGLTPMEAIQKAASKASLPLSAREYYGISTELNDEGKPTKKYMKNNDFYKLADINNEETRQLIQKNLIQNLDLDPNDPATYEKIKDIDIVVPKQNSHLSKLVKESDELAEFVAKNYESLKANPGKRLDDSIVYKKPSWRQDIGHGFWDKTNLYSIFKKSDISAKVNSDGSMTIIHPDTYDFGHMDVDNNDDFVNKKIARTNNRALGQQEKNQLKKYGLTALLTLSLEEIEALLKQSQKRKNNR